ncbi:MAG: hypothetical protein HOP12_08795 [Candidatus Eisenbacteria bacterium]|uniref:Peptidase C-terminal archaeal/bacterial domain-containing protein n=1 Tax=Eiseniibacteriota bacterium TaxID=2212470 RepID=A0A849SS96_UNCEI|nr:hypothetical protein [Candidatus Eisenbacteria bacterium]
MKRWYSSVAICLVALTWSAIAFANPANVVIETDAKAWSAAPSFLANVAETEPNNSLATAQFLGCGNILAPATIAVGAAPPDTDYVTFTANAGDLITVGTEANGTTGQVGDTRIRLFNNAGGVLASDDDAGPGLYSLIAGFVAPYTGTYYVGIAAFGSETGGYRAFLVCCPSTPPANDVCAGATPLPCGNLSLSGGTQCYTNNYTPLASGTGGCTGFTALGRDVVYRIDAGQADQLNVTYTSSGDGSIYIITDCNNPTTTCVAGADATLGGAPEVLSYVFPTAGTYYLVLDTFGTNSSGFWTLDGALQCVATPTRRATWGSIKSIYR